MEKYIGKVFKTKNYGDLVITNWVNHSEVYVKFISTGYQLITNIQSIKDGAVRDRYAPSIYGVGIIGDEISCTKGVYDKQYPLWKNMLLRCYEPKYHEKFPTYIGCEASDDFKQYSIFKKWCSEQTGFGRKGWVLDKDILYKGNKIYGMHTCCFVPHEINNLFVKNNSRRVNLPIGTSFCKRTGKYAVNHSFSGKTKFIGRYDTVTEAFEAYKEVKESYIKLIANKWKDQINPNVYKALMEYKVEITD